MNNAQLKSLQSCCKALYDVVFYFRESNTYSMACNPPLLFLLSDYDSSSALFLVWVRASNFHFSTFFGLAVLAVLMSPSCVSCVTYHHLSLCLPTECISVSTHFHLSSSHYTTSHFVSLYPRANHLCHAPLMFTVPLVTTAFVLFLLS